MRFYDSCCRGTHDGSKGSCSLLVSRPFESSLFLSFVRIHSGHVDGQLVHLCVHIFHHAGFLLLYAFSRRAPNTANVTSNTKTRVDTIVTSEVSVVIVDTWHPSGRVRISHCSAQCGQTFSSQAGARKGTRLELGTQVDDCRV
ncbi:hypothetical protein F4818DRAFT_383407 [Hypoxylon cercidicola]|nr:hypothetical protein F4818DRAFT_383407 [Hypoxylon cercidicola]